MSEMSQRQISLEELELMKSHLLAVDSLVKTCLGLVDKQDSLMKMEILQEVDCGMKCLESSVNCDPNGSSEKTWQDCFQSTMDEPWMKSSRDWKIQSTKSSRLYLQHQTIVRLLRGKGYSSLPRPRVADTEGAPVQNCEHSNGSWSRVNTKGIRYGVKTKDVLFKLYGLKRPHPMFYEAIMGFPIGWTDLSA